jgi:SAM-dependent methyltransferase
MQPDNKAIYDANWDRWTDQKVYGPASRWLSWLVSETLDAIGQTVIKDVIDVGCGQGSMTAMIADRLSGARVVGIDLSETGIRAAQASYLRPNLSFVVDIDSSRLEHAMYDLATCFEVLEHVEDWESMLHRICGASRRYVLLSFPTGRMRPFERAVGHVRNFQRGQVEEFMQRNGFDGLEIRYAGFPFYSPLYRDFCNLMDAGNSTFASGRYGLAQKIVGNVFFAMFRYLSSSRTGDQFCGLFERR